MEIDVTEYVTERDCSLYSDSVANSGLQNIGEVTWNNAKQHVAVEGLVTSEQQDELRDWIREFGAWDDEEIAAMSDQDTNALLLQFVAGAVQEMEAAMDGQVGHELYKADDGRWFFYVGN